MLNFWKDIQYAFRTLTKNPGFAIIGIVTLALGMAANTTIFSVVNGLILRPLSVPRPEQITVLALQQAGTAGLQGFSYPDFLDLRSQSASIGDLITYRVSLAGLAVEGKGDHCVISRVSNNYFSVLGITPAAGRLILPTEGISPGSDPIVVLGYSYWQKRFAGDPEVVGKHVEMNGHPATIVGVTPKGFYGTYAMLNMDAYVPLSATFTEEFGTPVSDTWTKREMRGLTILARLKPGVDIKRASASLNVVAKRLSDEHPDIDKGISVLVFPEKLARPEPDSDNSLPTVAFIFIALSSLVLLVACFNVANVLLVRATVRQREMAASPRPPPLKMLEKTSRNPPLEVLRPPARAPSNRSEKSKPPKSTLLGPPGRCLRGSLRQSRRGRPQVVRRRARKPPPSPDRYCRSRSQAGRKSSAS